MARIVNVVKAIEVDCPAFRKDGPKTFGAALDRRVIAATSDAEVYLRKMDQTLPSFLGVRARVHAHYVMLSVCRRKQEEEIRRYSQRLFRKGWTVFLDSQSLLFFLVGEFKAIIQEGCEQVSIPLKFEGRLLPLTVNVQQEQPLVDVHPIHYAGPSLDLSPFEAGEKLLLLR